MLPCFRSLTIEKLNDLVAILGNLGDTIVEARKEAGMTRAQLAKALGVHWRQLWGWETGNRMPRAETLRRIATVLNDAVNKPQ